MLYEPREDSLILAKLVKKYAKGSVLDVGTGTGILAEAAAQNADFVIGVDINKDSVEYCKNKIKNKKIKFFASDLFEIFKNGYFYLKNKKIIKNNKKTKFDTITFNPPYLPEDERDPDVALDGGKHGYELTERFLDEVNDYLNKDGIILIVFSFFTKKEKVDEAIDRNLLAYELLHQEHISFESLYFYLIKKNKILRKIEEKEVENIRFLAKGKRGLVYKGKYRGKDVVIKIKNPKSTAIARIEIEGKFLEKLNKYKIGPKLHYFDKDMIIMEFVKGNFFINYIKKNQKEKIKKIVDNIEKQLEVLDRIKINKEEMMRPYKNVIVRNNKPVLIDFERCRYSKNPKNMRQFKEFKRKIGIKSQ